MSFPWKRAAWEVPLAGLFGLMYGVALLGLIALVFGGCATVQPIQIQEGLIYTICSESPNHLNKEVLHAKKQGMTEHGGQTFRPYKYEGVDYTLFCQQLIKKELSNE